MGYGRQNWPKYQIHVLDDGPLWGKSLLLLANLAFAVFSHKMEKHSLSLQVFLTPSLMKYSFLEEGVGVVIFKNNQNKT